MKIVEMFTFLSVFMPTYFTNAVLVVFASGNAADNFFTKKWMIRAIYFCRHVYQSFSNDLFFVK